MPKSNNKRKNRRNGKTTLGQAKASVRQPRYSIPQALQRAAQLHNAGALPQAEGPYRQILDAEPNHPIALNLLGYVAYQMARYDSALELITKAIAARPNYFEAHNNLGNTLNSLGRPEDAVACYEKVIAIKPDYPDAHNNLGNTFNSLRRPEDAVGCYQRAIAIKPDYPEAYNNLGYAFKHLGRLHDAATNYQDAITIRPDFPDAHANLGVVLHELGRLDHAIVSFRTAISLDPKNEDYWTGLAAALENFTFTSVDADLLDLLLRLVEHPTIPPHIITPPIFSALYLNPDFSSLYRTACRVRPRPKYCYADAAGRLSQIPLLLRIMAVTPVNYLEMERMLTGLRHAMLQETASGHEDRNGLRFSVALALNCFINEYVFFETAEETAVVAQLEQRIATLIEAEENMSPALVTALGAYRPLHRYSWAGRLLEREWPDEIEKLIMRQVAEPLEEKTLRGDIQRLTPIQDAVSQTVRQQYEESPYPRWIKTGVSAKDRTVRSALDGPPLYFDMGDYESPERPEILIAGCGTGQHAINTTWRFSNARVLAVDLSLSSLAYATRKAREFGLPDIEFGQADIMELATLDRHFDLIESVGVLHHLGDPMAGWRVLVDLLRPGGLMKIGLYSESARRNVVKGRALIAEQGYTDSPEDIRRFRQEIMAMDDSSEISRLRVIRDFFSLSECRDLLFHVQEHRFTVPQIEDALNTLGLKFLGFENSNGAVAAFGKVHPGKNALTSLSRWHEFELDNPDTFQGMYQFWCRKI